MKTDVVINQLSTRIDNLLDNEKKVNDFATVELRKLVIEILEDSYKKAREMAGLGVGENLAFFGIAIAGSLASRPDFNRFQNSEREEHEEKQNQIDRKWHKAKKRLDSCSAVRLYQIIHLNRKQTFDVTINFILNQ